MEILRRLQLLILKETHSKAAPRAEFRVAHKRPSKHSCRIQQLCQDCIARLRLLGDTQEFPKPCKSYVTEVSSCWMKRFVFSAFLYTAFW